MQPPLHRNGAFAAIFISSLRILPARIMLPAHHSPPTAGPSLVNLRLLGDLLVPGLQTEGNSDATSMAEQLAEGIKAPSHWETVHEALLTLRATAGRPARPVGPGCPAK